MDNNIKKPAKKDPQEIIRKVEAKRKELRKKEEQKKRMIFSIAALVVLVVLILLLCKGCGKKDDPVIDEPDGTPAVTQAVTPDATPVPDAEPTAAPAPAVYLDVIKRGPTKEKVIAVTVDSIGSVDNLNAIMDVCESNKCAVTLFPTGKAVTGQTTLQSALRRAYQLKCEIGNFGNENKNLYSLTEDDMAKEIYDQNQAVSKALGFNYSMHLLRTRGGKGENDLRTHQYLEQLGGYKAIVDWTVEAEDVSIANLKKGIKNGYIYKFTTSDADTKKLAEFIPYAVSQGYKLVTVSAMMGYGDNEVSVLTEEEAPAPIPFVYSEYVMLGGKDYMQCYAVQLLQKRLIELGYLPADSTVDGDYGSRTKTAVKYFQNNSGMNPDGIAGPATQQLLFSDEAKPFTPAATEAPAA